MRRISMKQPSALRGALLFGCAVALAACAPPPRTGAVRPGVEQAPVAAVDSVGVYELESEGEFPDAGRDVVFEEDALPPRPEEMVALPLEEGAVDVERVEPVEVEELPLAPSTPVPVEPTNPAPVAPGGNGQVARGFRVQLLALKDRLEAEERAREARTRLGVGVYVVFESPLYKVRAGDFLDRGEALVLRERARANGYDGAWVVTTEIRIQP